jgi:hypothetical protein
MVDEWCVDNDKSKQNGIPDSCWNNWKHCRWWIRALSTHRQCLFIGNSSLYIISIVLFSYNLFYPYFFTFIEKLLLIPFSLQFCFANLHVIRASWSWSVYYTCKLCIWRECAFSGPKPSYLGSFSNSLVYQVMFLLQTFKSEIRPDWIALFEIVWLMMAK